MSCSCKQAVRGAIGLTKVALQIDLATPEQIQSRRDVCRACEFATRNERFTETSGLTTVSQCLKCGCFIAAKTRLAGEVCPLGKWQAG